MTSHEFHLLWSIVCICTAILQYRRIIPDIKSSDTSGIIGETLLGCIIGLIVGIFGGIVFWGFQSGIPYEEVSLGSARIGLMWGLTLFWGALTLFMLLTETTALAVAVVFANVITLFIGNISVYLTQGTNSLIVTLVMSVIVLIIWTRQIYKKLINT